MGQNPEEGGGERAGCDLPRGDGWTTDGEAVGNGVGGGGKRRNSKAHSDGRWFFGLKAKTTPYPPLRNERG